MTAELVADCPRCPAKQITFSALSSFPKDRLDHGWVTYHDVFCVCKNCSKTTVFVLRQSEYNDADIIVQKGPLVFGDSLNNHFTVAGYVSLKDMASVQPPDSLPAEIETVFREGATCAAMQCWNAAGTMFRAALDLATRPMLPPAEGEQPEGLNPKVRRDLGLRLPWMFKHRYLASDLEELSTCIHQDGNDGAHQGTLTKHDVDDLLDFTHALLTRLYTEPAKLQAARERREQRRAVQKEAEAASVQPKGE